MNNLRQYDQLTVNETLCNLLPTEYSPFVN